MKVKHFSRMSLLPLVSVLVAFSAPAASAAAFQNGSFESFDSGAANVLCPDGINFCGQYNAGNSGINGWTIGGHSVDVVGIVGWTASNGAWSIDLSGVGAGSLSQSFDTVAGTSYQVTFDLGGNFYGGPNIKTGVVSAAGSSQSLSFNNAASTATNMGWMHQSFTFVATEASTALSFTSTTDGNAGIALDNITITPVPEPETYAMMLAGLGLLGVVARRRKQKLNA
jgi:choice-of-anchor C domain-containing protein